MLRFLLWHVYLDLPFTTHFGFCVFNPQVQGSGLKWQWLSGSCSQWFLCLSFPCWVEKIKFCESLWKGVVCRALLLWTTSSHSGGRTQPGFTLTLSDPDVPSEPVLLFGKDLQGDRIIIFLSKSWDFIIFKSPKCYRIWLVDAGSGWGSPKVAERSTGWEYVLGISSVLILFFLFTWTTFFFFFFFSILARRKIKMLDFHS